MGDILNIVKEASPAVAAAIIIALFQIRSLQKEVASLKDRLKDYDSLNIEATLASIRSDLSWIRAKLEGKI